MEALVIEWAGVERSFQLRFGDVLDLEEAAGDGIGVIFARVASGRFSARDVYHTIRLALIGGGMGEVDARRLIDQRFGARPFMANAVVAGEILSAIMVGVEPIDEKSETDGNGRYLFSEVSQICRVFNMSPGELREMRYADFVNLVRGFNAASADKAPHITEEEFESILNRYEPEALS